jgi:hypothetical protein
MILVVDLNEAKIFPLLMYFVDFKTWLETKPKMVELEIVILFDCLFGVLFILLQDRFAFFSFFGCFSCFSYFDYFN